MKNILVLGTGGSATTNFIRSLRLSGEKFNIIGTDSNKYYIQRSEADKNYLIPLCTHQDYISALKNIVKKEKIDFIHLQNDKEISVISEYRKEFKDKLFLPSKETIRICLDKYRSYLKWKNVVPQPKKFIIKTKANLKSAFKELNGIKWLREITGAGGRGSLKTEDLDEAFYWINKHNGWGKFEVAEYLSDQSITWSSIWKDGKLIVAQGRKRLFWELAANTLSGVTGATGAAVTISDNVLDGIAEASILAIDKKPHGIFSVDLTYDKNGAPNPTEINISRFFTTILFFTEAGLNMPLMYTKLFFNEAIKVDKRYNPLTDNYVWIRGMDFLPKLLTPEKFNSLK